MALRERGFRAYRGERSPERLRFTVVARYALADALALKKALFLLVASLFAPFVAAVFVYLHHNPEALAILEIALRDLIPIDARFFLFVLQIQTTLAFFLVLLTGASLVNADTRDNALPLYLGRPLGRWEYVLGKLVVLVGLGGAVNCGLVLALFAFQAGLEPAWLLGHLRLGLGLLVGGLLACLLFSLVVLAVSALVRSRAAAEGSYVAFFVALPVVGTAIRESLDADWAELLNLPGMVVVVWRALLGLPLRPEVGVVGAATVILLVMGGCLAILARRVRAYEVSR